MNKIINKRIETICPYELSWTVTETENDSIQDAGLTNTKKVKEKKIIDIKKKKNIN